MARGCEYPENSSTPLGNDKSAGHALFFAVNRAGAGDVFFNRRIARIGNFSRASNGDFQGLGNRDFRIPCAGRGDFGGLSLQAACF